MSTPLIEAINQRDRRKVAALLRRGADPNEKEPLVIYRPLWHAVAVGDLAIVNQLLNAGADLRTMPEAFFGALKVGRVEIVKRLLAAGADPNAAQPMLGASGKPIKPKPALAFARECRDKKAAAELMILLLEAGARVANPAKKLAELRRHGVRDPAERLRQEVRFRPTPPSPPKELRDGQAEFDLASAGYAHCLYDRDVLNRTRGELADMSFGPAARVRSLLGRRAYLPIEVNSKVLRSRFRVVTREWTGPEAAEWVGRVAWRLDLASGLLGLCGGRVCDAEADCRPVYVRVPAGRYAVEVYNYLPEAAGCAATAAWNRMLPDAEEYFRRTRPGEPLPPWLRRGRQPRYVDFLVRLTPGAGPSSMPRLAQGLFAWECRQPAQCPLGLPAVS